MCLYVVIEMFLWYDYEVYDVECCVWIFYYMQIGYYVLDVCEFMDVCFCCVVGYFNGFMGQDVDLEVFEEFCVFVMVCVI